MYITVQKYHDLNVQLNGGNLGRDETLASKMCLKSCKVMFCCYLFLSDIHG